MKRSSNEEVDPSLIQQFVTKWVDTLIQMAGDKAHEQDNVRNLLNEVIESPAFLEKSELQKEQLHETFSGCLTLQAMIVTWAEASIKEMRAKKTREENNRTISNLRSHFARVTRAKTPVNYNEGALRKQSEKAAMEQAGK